MADLTTEEIGKGKKQLSGPKNIFWIAFVILIIGAIGTVVSFFTGFFGLFSESGGVLTILSSIASLGLAILWVVLVVVELVGIGRGRPYAVGLGRFLLIMIMIFTFPVGTIIGAIVWKRFSHPAAQKYLNYIK